jgi:hypothetical protein
VVIIDVNSVLGLQHLLFVDDVGYVSDAHAVSISRVE